MQQEAIGERRQAFIVRQAIGGAHAHAQWHAQARVATAELAFVQ